ncbi:MAG: hypothetical protein HDS65_03550 [Bacteroidales bacterium]|nr:hypothetical protein [Bacteroidales bacterium]
MAKLQLYLTKSLNGTGSLLNINPSEEVSRFVQDFRPVLSCLEYDVAVSHVFYLVSYTGEGLLLAVIRTIAGEEAGSYLSGTIFVPTGTEVANEEILHLATSLADMLDSNGNAPDADEVAALRQSYSTDFAENPDAPRYPQSAGQHCALAFFGEGAISLADYAAVRFFQPSFPKYACVILTDAASGVTGKEGVDNVTPTRIVPTAVLLPPRKTPQGFVPYIERKRFAKPAVVAVNTDVEIEWQRPGFDAIVQVVRAEHPDTEVRITPPDTSDVQKVISPSSFRVTIQGSQQPVGDVAIKVNDVEIDGAKSYPYHELVSARVEVSSNGYAPFTGSMDLAATTVALVQLKPLRRTYRFDLPLNTPEPSEPVRIYLKTRRPLKKCPIEGYAVAGGDMCEGTTASNSLYYVGGSRSTLGRYRHIIYGVFGLIAGIFIGSLVSGLFHAYKPAKVEPIEMPKTEAPAPAADTKAKTKEPVVEPTPAPTEAAAEKPAEEKAAPKVTDYKKAVAYLDGNKTWTREGMADIPGLEGLFDDLNTYNFARLKEYWAPLLSSSRNFSSVMAAVNGSSTKRDPRTGAHKPNYNAAGDNSINWLSYTYWIDP